MHLGRFHHVVSDLAEHFKRANLSTLLDEACSALDQYVNSREPSHIDAFRRAYEQALKSAEITNEKLQLPYAQQVITSLGFDSLLGLQLSNKIRKAVSQNSYDQAAVSERLRKLRSDLQIKVDVLLQLDKSLETLSVEYEELKPNESEFGLLIPRQVVGNDLESLSKELNRILRLFKAFGELTNAEQVSPTVSTISSSWWEVFVQLSPDSIAAWVVAIERIVALYKNNLEIKLLQDKIRKMELGDDAIQLMQQKIDTSLQQGLQQLASEMRAQFGRNEDIERANELETQLKHGLLFLAKRIGAGAHVEINVGLPQEQAEQPTEGEPPEIAQQRQVRIEQQRQKLEELTNLQNRAMATSAETLSLDRSTPLLLPDLED